MVKNFSVRKKICIISASIIIIFSVLITILGLTLSITGWPVTNKVVFASAAPWNTYLRYDYKGYDYSVTNNVVPPILVGRKIGWAIWNGSINSNDAYEMYTIKFEWNYRQIAFKTKYGYLIANKEGKTKNIAVVTSSGG